MNKKRLLVILVAVLAMLVALAIGLDSCQASDDNVPAASDPTTESTADPTIFSTESEETVVFTEEPTVSETEASVEEPTEVPGETPTEPEESENPDSTDSAAYKEVNETVYATTDVNVRSGAGTEYEQLGRITKGTAIKRTGIGDNGWSRVEYNGKTAYISSEYLTTEKPAGETEPTETQPTGTDHKHDYKSTIVAPTCTSKGYTTHTCACGDTYRDSETKATGHAYTTKITKEATCTEKGVMTYTCTNSGCSYSYTEEFNAKGHKYETTTVAPTTEAKGYDLHTCSVCGNSYKNNYTDKLPTETKPSHSHSYKSEITKAATCTEDGVKTFTCSCGASYTETIAKTGHSWGDWVRTKEPTTEAEGQETRTCANCGGTETRAVEKLPSNVCTNHSWGNWTSNDNGSYGSCTNCGQSITIDGSTSVNAKEVIDIINEYRLAEGLDTVEWYASKRARIRAHELTVCYSHERPDGSMGYDKCIAAGYSNARAVVDAWMASSNHRGSLMNPNATEASAAYNGTFWVLII